MKINIYKKKKNKFINILFYLKQDNNYRMIIIILNLQ